jgi:biotin operon repressor
VSDSQGLPTELHARIAFALGMTPEALAPLLHRLRDAGLEVVRRDELARLQESDRLLQGATARIDAALPRAS